MQNYLNSRLRSFYIHRTKADVLAGDLPMKDERVLFCELSPMQKRLYEHVLSLPDFQLLKYANAPCDCGINKALFEGYNRLRTDRERLDYQRRHRDDVVKRKECCYKVPLNPNRFKSGEPMYDPRAMIWGWQHNSDEPCKRCPYCMIFPALDKLYKLSSHVALLQVNKHPKSLPQGSKAWKEASKELDFANVVIPPDVLRQLPGGHVRQDGIMNDHASLSGKMKALSQLLVEFDRRSARVLVFSFSTRTLDLIQNFVKSQGYTLLRLDGSTPTKARQGLVDRFQKDKNIFLFLISTKAGGLGLNLTVSLCFGCCCVCYCER